MIHNVKDENQNFKIYQRLIYMICSVKPLNYNLKNEKGTTQFVVSASYLNTDQQRIQENNACTKRMSLYKSYLTEFSTSLPKLFR